MQSFTLVLLSAATVSARGTTGGINQAYQNPSFSATHGFGYNERNDYIGGDSHGNALDVRAHGAGDGINYADFTKKNFEANTHIIGYDAIESTDTDTDFDNFNQAQADALILLINQAQEARNDYVTDLQKKRSNHLETINANVWLPTMQAPFDYQLHMIEKELGDIDQAEDYAVEDQDEAYEDLLERMEDFYNAKIAEMEAETDKVMRTIDRAVRDSKPVDEVFFSMRLDWLQGVSINGKDSFVFSDDVYDLKSQFDGVFDIFTFDIGKGKGHGHTNTGIRNEQGNDRETGFVVGRGGGSDISTLQGEPVAKDGTRRRYDR